MNSRAPSRTVRSTVLVLLFLLAGVIVLGTINGMVINSVFGQAQRAAQGFTGDDKYQTGTSPSLAPAGNTGSTAENKRIDQVTSYAAADAALAVVVAARSVNYQIAPSVQLKNMRRLMGDSLLREIADRLLAEDWKTIASNRTVITANAVKVTPYDLNADDGRTFPSYVVVDIVRYQQDGTAAARPLNRESWRVELMNGGQGLLAYSMRPQERR